MIIVFSARKNTYYYVDLKKSCQSDNTLVITQPKDRVLLVYFYELQVTQREIANLVSIDRA